MTLPPPLVGTWVPCPVCTAWRCATCPGTNNFTPADPPVLLTLTAEEVASVVDMLMSGQTEGSFYDCRIELYPKVWKGHAPEAMEAHTYLVDRRDRDPYVVSPRDNVPWRDVLLEAKRRGHSWPTP